MNVVPEMGSRTHEKENEHNVFTVFNSTQKKKEGKKERKKNIFFELLED